MVVLQHDCTKLKWEGMYANYLDDFIIMWKH